MEGIGLKRTYLLILLNISIASIFGLAGCGGYEKRAEAYYNEGMELFHQEDFEAAGRNFKLVAYSFKHSPQADSTQEYIQLCEAGVIAVRARDFFFGGNLVEARRQTELAMEKGEHLPAAVFISWLVAYKMGETEKALLMFKQLEQESDAGDYVALATAAEHILNRQYQQGQEILLSFFNQTNLRSMKELALKELLMARLAEPVAGARNLVSLFPPNHPDLALVYYISGESYAGGDGYNYDLAVMNLRRAFELAPGTKVATDAEIAVANLLLGKTTGDAEKKRDLEEALLLAEDALQYYPDNMDYLFTRNEAQRILHLMK